MRRAAHFFLFTVLLLSSLTALAQTAIEGVVSSSSGGAIEYATVGIVGSSRPAGAVADEKGRYSLRVDFRDSVTLRFSATGYEPQEITVLATGEVKMRVDCMLKPLTTQLKEVTINDEKSRATAFTQIDAKKLEDVVGPQGGVESLLKTLPDVSSNNELSSQYSVRGGSFDENLVYINGVEIYRPLLVRSGQQEGVSIINPDMVDHILFSPGGFNATAGDRMSSVLDITYSRPVQFRGKISASLLGATAHIEGPVGKRFTYSIGFRRHSNQYIFSSLDTKGTYKTAYTDIQSVLAYRFSERLNLSALILWNNNRYGLVPESQTTTFGSFMQAFELDVYFDGQEVDRYTSTLGALKLDWRPNETTRLQWLVSAQSNREQEYYDIQSQYWLYELGLAADAEVKRFDRGVGTFLEHARNRLNTSLFSTELRGSHYVRLGSWQWGVKLQLEQIDDHMREWKWVDSAGYAMPTTHDVMGDSGNRPEAPRLQQFCNASNSVNTIRIPLYLQRDISITTRHDVELKATAGIRSQYYQMCTQSFGQEAKSHQWIVSPRIGFSVKPNWKNDMLFRTALGVYQQPPFYREMRYPNGSLNIDARSQTSYQVMETLDWNMRLWGKPFKLTADIYYKYLTNLIPYTIDNLRIRYDAENSAHGYAAGLSVRVNGEFVEGLESWASISLLRTQEDIDGDGLGWLSRPTDQRFSFKMFLQDYIPSFPWWKMSVNFIYGTGVPVTFPYQKDRSVEHRLPPYLRVDWGNSVQLSRIKGAKHWKLFRHIDDILVGFEVFNLFNYRNVVSYIWVADYENTYYPVPNYLTARQLNIKLTVMF